MYVDRRLWRRSFRGERFPLWPCPRCPRGTLVLVPESGKQRETYESKRVSKRVEDYWDACGERQLYSCELSCGACAEPVALVGEAVLELHREYDDEGDEHEDLEWFVQPQFLFPAIPVINIAEGVPEEVKAPLGDAFSLIWSSPSACAARLRAALEALMDARKIKKKRRVSKKKGGFKFHKLTLHDRLTEFAKAESEVGKFLIAAKWLGNAGAHSDDVDREAALDGFELISVSLSMLYDERAGELRKTAARLTKRKGL